MSSHPETHTQHLIFELGGESFAVGTPPIREIIEYTPHTAIPMTPDFLHGVVNVRGTVVPVIDISVRFGRPKTVVGRRTCIVIIEVESGGEKHMLGALVDTVKEVQEIPEDQIEPRPEFGLCMPAEFVSGLIRLEAGFIIILDIAKVLSADELSELIEVTAATSPSAEPASHG